MANRSRVREFRRGWRVVLAAMVGMGLGATGLPFYSIGLFIRPLSHAYGWTHAQTAGVSLCEQGGVMIMAPFIGALADRWGARRLAPLSLMGVACAFGTLSILGDNLLGLYLGWFSLALLGSGTTPVVWSRVVSSWFDFRRGIALGVVLAGTGVAAVVAPLTLGAVIARYGWRMGFATAACVTAVAVIPVWLLLPSREAPAANRAVPLEALGMTLSQAVRTVRFWQAGVAFFLVAGSVAAMIVHLTPLLADNGVPPARIGAVAGMLGLAIIAGRLGVGLLVDRFHAPYVAFAFLVIAALAGVALATGYPSTGVVLLGLATGAEIDLLAFLAGRYFGLRAYGAIYGCLVAAFSLGAGIGPILLGAVRDRAGTYAPGLFACSALILSGSTLIATLGRYRFGVGAASEKA